MSELLAPLGVPPEIEDQTGDTVQPVAPAPAAVVHEPVLITEEEVLFATAAAVPSQPAKTRGWVSRVVGAIVGAASVTSNDDGRPKPRNYPPRYDFLEDARMAREMYRL